MTETVTCPFCSLHCTGLHLEWAGDRLSKLLPACDLAKRKYHQSIKMATLVRDTNDSFQSIHSIKAMLDNSRRLAVVLCSDLPQEVVPAAVDFCKKQSAFLVTDDEFTGNILSLAVKEAGILTASLGEFSGCTSQVICCGKDILQTLPRLDEFLPVLGSGQVQYLLDDSPLTTLQNLRLETRTQSTSPAHKHGLVLFDRTWLQEDLHITSELLAWLADLNRGQRWYGLFAPPAANSLGICNALLSSAGYPGSMHLSSTGTEYNPRQYQLHQLLQNGWIDSCIIAGSPDLLSASLKKDLEKVTTILLSPEPADWEPTLYLSVARAGVDCQGTMQRLDFVPLSLHPLLKTGRLTIEEIFNTLTVGGAV